MTELCGGGASEAKPTTPGTVALIGTAVEFLITQRIPWLAPFVSVFAPYVFEASTFCADDPPPMPEWTPADLGFLLTGGSGAKLAQTVQFVAWYAFCQCASTTTPEPVVPPPPDDMPVIQPGPIGACDSATYTPIPATTPPTGNTHPFQGAIAGDNTITGRRALPVGATHMEVTVTRDVPLGSEVDTYRVVVLASAAEGGAGQTVIFSQQDIGGGWGYTKVYSGTIPAGMTGWVGQVNNIGGVEPTDLQLTVTVRVYCGGAPGSLQPACCPPDPTLAAKVDQIYALLTEVQRQGVPFAYVPGLSYTGLSGTGEITFTDPILRAQVDITTLPNWYGFAEGDPDRLFDIGYVAMGTADGFERPKAITNTPFLFPVRGDITKLAYAFGVGIVATIRTFSREPA